MAKRLLNQANNFGISFFQKKDTIKTEKYGNSETFESPKRQIEQLGQASLLFTKFNKNDIPMMYKKDENAYALDSFGNFMMASAQELALSNMYELMIMLRTKKKVEDDQMICNLWLKDHTQVFSTYMDSNSTKKNHSVLYLGGFSWWSSEEVNIQVKKLLLPKSMNILSNLCISVVTIPKQYQKKDLDDDIDDMFFW